MKADRFVYDHPDEIVWEDEEQPTAPPPKKAFVNGKLRVVKDTKSANTDSS